MRRERDRLQSSQFELNNLFFIKKCPSSNLAFLSSYLHSNMCMRPPCGSSNSWPLLTGVCYLVVCLCYKDSKRNSKLTEMIISSVLYRHLNEQVSSFLKNILPCQKIIRGIMKSVLLWQRL
jgi:hypothetical protein